jgi:hypothetical protein
MSGPTCDRVTVCSAGQAKRATSHDTSAMDARKVVELERASFNTRQSARRIRRLDRQRVPDVFCDFAVKRIVLLAYRGGLHLVQIVVVSDISSASSQVSTTPLARRCCNETTRTASAQRRSTKTRRKISSSKGQSASMIKRRESMPRFLLRGSTWTKTPWETRCVNQWRGTTGTRRGRTRPRRLASNRPVRYQGAGIETRAVHNLNSCGP